MTLLGGCALSSSGSGCGNGPGEIRDVETVNRSPFNRDLTGHLVFFHAAHQYRRSANHATA